MAEFSPKYIVPQKKKKKKKKKKLENYIFGII